MDIAGGLTQVLSDGTNTYLYGAGRITQQHDSLTEYYLDDALGSVRQLTDSAGEVVLARAYDPYGNLVENNAYTGVTTAYGYAGEYTDASGMVYLRARYYSPVVGRFVSRDVWEGDYNNPLSLNKWGYVEGNPINYADPTGFITTEESGDAANIVMDLVTNYQIGVVIDWGYISEENGQYFALSINPSPEWIGVLSQYGCWKWITGEWSLEELIELQDGVHRLAKEMKGKFVSNMPTGFKITQKDLENPGEFDRPNTIILDSYSTNPKDFDHWTVVHEFAHAWDYNYNWSLSDGLMAFTGGLINPRIPPKGCDEQNWRPGCNLAGYFYGGVPAKGSDVNFNKKEDFAESVAAYIYPDEAQAYVKDRFSNTPLFYSDYRTLPRWKYINSLLK